MKKFKLKYSFLFWVVLPTLLALLYYTFWATPQYVVESRFAVRTGQEAPQNDLLGGLIGQSSSSSDAYIVTSYIGSQDLVRAVNKKVDLSKVYGGSSIDYFSRLDTKANATEQVDYWNRRVSATYDATTGIIDLKVNAFTPEDTLNLSDNILKNSEELVNDLSRRARQDTLSLAEKEVKRAEGRLSAVKKDITSFRNRHQELDPEKTAAGKMQIINSLQGELAKAEAGLISLRTYARSSAPSVQALESKIQGLKRQIANEESSLSSDSSTQSGAMTSLVDTYESLLIEREFAEKLYSSALVSLEAAQMDASKKYRYLTVFVKPVLPDEAAEPKPFEYTLTVFLAAFLLWGIGSIALASVKDHIGWV